MAINLNLDSIMKLPLSRRILILAGINLLIVGLSYYMLLAPKYAEKEDLKARLAQIERKLNESRAIARDIPRFEKEKKELEEKLKLALAQLPNEKEIPDLIDSISAAGRESGLKILLFKPRGEVPKGFYAEVPVDMTVEGRFDSIFNFSVKISKLPRIVNISKIDIKTTGYKDREPMLKAQFVATTFRFIPGDKGDKGKGRK